MISYDLIKDVFDLDSPLTLEYFELCSKDTDEPKYFHKHHILPKSMFPEYARSVWNIVRLAYQDHYRAHFLLLAICVIPKHKQKMALAFSSMSKAHNKNSWGYSAELYALVCKVSKEFSSGQYNPMYGRRHTQETIVKLKSRVVSEENKQLMSQRMTGVRQSDERRKQSSERMKGEKNPMYGKTHTEEVIELLRQANVGKVLSAAQKERIAVQNTGEGNPFYGKKHSQEAKDRMSLKHTGKIVSEETRRKQSAQRLGVPKSPEHIRNSAEARKIPLDEFLKFLHSNTNLELVGEYDGVSKKTVFKCNKGHPEFLRTPYHVKTGRVCNHCKKELRETTLQTQTPQR